MEPPDALTAGAILAAALIAGLVRGFSGFGTAMIFMPIAGVFLPPMWAITALVVMDVFGPIPNLRRAWGDAHPGDLARLIVGTIAVLPLGYYVLHQLDPDMFRAAVSLLALLLVAALAGGLRYGGTLPAPAIVGTGAIGGFLGGVAGMPGPPVILLYMASRHPTAVIRANNMLYLFLFDICMIVLLAVSFSLSLAPVLIGALAAIPNTIGNMIGARMFRAGNERTYRRVAYGVIAASAIVGAPLWG